MQHDLVCELCGEIRRASTSRFRILPLLALSVSTASAVERYVVKSGHDHIAKALGQSQVLAIAENGRIEEQ